MQLRYAIAQTRDRSRDQRVFLDGTAETCIGLQEFSRMLGIAIWPDGWKEGAMSPV